MELKILLQEGKIAKHTALPIISATSLKEQLGPGTCRQSICQGVDVEDLEEMAAIVHAANGKPKH